MVLKLIATCPDETTDVLAKELRELGATDIIETFRAVHCHVEPEAFYKAHLRLRSASTLMLEIASFSFRSEQDLQRRAAGIRWDRYFSNKKTYLVDGVAGDRGDRFLTANEISRGIRLGLEKSYRTSRLIPPRVDLRDTKVIIRAFCREGRCTLSLDTSGKSLHKRGFRLAGHPAPMKENLAAAILLKAGYDGTQPFFDPMCGSGTIAIEAALIALNKSPLIHRKKGEFGFENLKLFDKDLWRKVQEDERQRRLEEPLAPLFASDESDSFVELARRIALRARVEKHIDFKTADFFKLEAPAPRGILVANLPYGERLGDQDELLAFYKRIGDHLKRNFQGWRAVFLTSDDAPYKHIGLKPTRKALLKNGAIECRLVTFDIFGGTYRDHKYKDTATETPSP